MYAVLLATAVDTPASIAYTTSQQNQITGAQLTFAP